ncbi:Uncharacterized protein Fot_12253 [Forsythia ovata]|uniref:LisH domain-containing protein n=1 Tax=Forsythia ovata TaxID=205694 RepID=A0ABD1WM02_9LAMI
MHQQQKNKVRAPISSNSINQQIILPLKVKVSVVDIDYKAQTLLTSDLIAESCFPNKLPTSSIKYKPRERKARRSANRSLSWSTEDLFSATTPGSNRAEEDEEALKWAALEKLPTYNRLRKTVIKSFFENKVVHKEVDVRKLDMNDKQEFIDRIFKVTDEDNEKIMKKLTNRIACFNTKIATSKEVITREEWEKRLNDVKVRKEDMNKLVMNFLVTEGYVEAAEKFRLESGTEPDIDHATITDRMAVKKAVQCGNMEDAIEKVR